MFTIANTITLYPYSAVSHINIRISLIAKRKWKKNLHSQMMSAPPLSPLHERSGSVVVVLRKDKIFGRKLRSGSTHAGNNGGIPGPHQAGTGKLMIPRTLIHFYNLFHIIATYWKQLQSTNSAINLRWSITHSWKMLSWTTISLGQLLQPRQVWALSRIFSKQ